jgi:hypothetical protein
MTRLIRVLLIGLIAAVLAALVVIDVDAAGLSVGPARIEKIDALRGDEYRETIHVKYLDESDCLIRLSATGDISDWVSFYELDDQNTPIEATTASAGEWTHVLVKLTVPDDAPIGMVAGTLKIETASPDENGGGTTVALTGKIDVRVDVVTAVGSAGGTIGPALRNTIIGVAVGIAALAALIIWLDISRRKKAYARRSHSKTQQRVTSEHQKSTPGPRSQQKH